MKQIKETTTGPNADVLAAIVLIICCTVLIACGFNGEVKSMLGMAAGWCFARGYKAVKADKEGE